MNRRIMKKLSKKAVSMLEQLGENCGIILDSEAEDGFMGCHLDRKHWDRMTVSHGLAPVFNGDIKHPAKTPGRWVILSSNYVHVLARTPLISWMSGHEEPEWETETVYNALSERLHWELAEWVDVEGQEFPEPVFRDLSTPSKVFTAARDLIAKAAA